MTCQRVFLAVMTVVLAAPAAPAEAQGIIDAVGAAMRRDRVRRRVPKPPTPYTQVTPSEPKPYERPTPTASLSVGSQSDSEGLAKEYTACINEMNVLSVALFELFEAENSGGKVGPTARGETPDEAMARTGRVKERAERALETIAQLKAAVRRAAKLQPALCDTLDRLSKQLAAESARMEFKDSKAVLHVKSEQLARVVEQLRTNPVSLPANLDRTERYVRESVAVMEQTLKADRLRGSLRLEDLSRRATELGLQGYVDFYAAWRDDELVKWREQKLPKLYEPLGTPIPPEVARRAEARVTPQGVGTSTPTTRP